jgi:hypothetical protein
MEAAAATESTVANVPSTIQIDVRRFVVIPDQAPKARADDERIVVVVAIAIFDRTDSNQVQAPSMSGAPSLQHPVREICNR